MRSIQRTLWISAALVLATASAPPAGAEEVELITNGTFETGDFTGWTVSDMSGVSHSYFVLSGIGLPLAELLTVGPAGGTYFAVSDMVGSGTSALVQAFTVPGPAESVVLSFDMFVNDFNQWLNGSPAIIDPIGLDHTGPDNQHSRVDIMSASAGPFDTGAGVISQLYIGTDPNANPSGIPYISYQLDITSAVGAGGTFQLRFAQTDNQLWLNQGIDNVSIVFKAAQPEAVPTLVGWALGGLALALASAGAHFSRPARLPAPV